LAHRRLADALAPYGTHIHAMSLFGLILGLRLIALDSRRRLTAGIYHQNEFLYRPSPFHFAREGLKLFAEMPAENIVFFNESSRDNYADHFANKAYVRSHLLPIGVALDQPPVPVRAHPGQHIVSIGNLADFKTYNRHMIAVVAAMRERFPNIRYDIYGIGPAAGNLAALAETLGVSDRVTFQGQLDYARLREVVAACDLFVGSGTALIEAAAVGRPALIGIESIEQPETYGYLNDARGYSYNENVPGVPKRPIAPMVERLFSDPNHWTKVAAACAVKAQSFSIAATADGFEAADKAARPITHRLSSVALARLAISAITMRAFERLCGAEPFGDRRNQSY
jgi:1,2-diacylglycerol 3-alpha-glucosyltransferase